MLRRAALIVPILLLLIPVAIAATDVVDAAVDLETERAALRATDRAFATALAGQSFMRFQGFFAPDAVFLGDRVFRGPGAIAEAYGLFFKPEAGATIEWSPSVIEVAASGDLAYTVGDTEVRMPGPDGETTVQPGRFVTVWRKDAAAVWKIQATGALVVSLDPNLGPIHDRLAALAQVWPPMVPLDAELKLETTPETVLTSASGELAVVIGSFRVQARRGEEMEAGSGGYLRLFEQDEDGTWRTIAESLSPPR